MNVMFWIKSNWTRLDHMLGRNYYFTQQLYHLQIKIVWKKLLLECFTIMPDFFFLIMHRKLPPLVNLLRIYQQMQTEWEK